MSNDAGEEKKIIIDEGWKERVQAEKEAAEQAATKNRAEKPEKRVAPAAESGPLPPVDFSGLVGMLATRAMMSLGAVPHPVSGKADVQLDTAKHFIDLLKVLEEKTQGNLSPQETTMLGNMLHELRTAFIACGSQPPADAADVGEPQSPPTDG